MQASDSAKTSLTSVALMDYLEQRGIEAELLQPGCPMPTVPLAAEAIGVHEDQIIKTLVFRAGDGELVVAIASGTARIDRARLASAAGVQRLKLADPETVLNATGFPAGGVAPVGHSTPVRVIIDRKVMNLDVVYGGGGSEDALLRLRTSDILVLTGAEIADIVAIPAA